MIYFCLKKKIPFGFLAGGGFDTDPHYLYLSYVPMEVSLEVVGRDACELTYVDSLTTTNDMLCATGWGVESYCQGDSGGPVIKKNPNGNHSKDVLIGVVSWGVGCIYHNRPDVYSRVSASLSWFLSV